MCLMDRGDFTEPVVTAAYLTWAICIHGYFGKHAALHDDTSLGSYEIMKLFNLGGYVACKRTVWSTPSCYSFQKKIFTAFVFAISSEKKLLIHMWLKSAVVGALLSNLSALALSLLQLK